ncbi:MAG TPA: glycoside hydrolase family 43 protein [Pyrinomonadaceae bacterium]|jgi:beta-xylosidase
MPRPHEPDATGVSRRTFLTRLTAGACAAGALVRGGFEGAGAAAPPYAQKTYTNPVYAGSMPDPFVLRHRGVYYAFGTTGGERKPDGRIFTLLRSDDLVNWRELGGALAEPTADRAYQFWAPEVAYDGGTFYLYYSMGGKEEEKFELRVATSRGPEGPYKDAGVKLLDCESNRFTIDAHPFQDTDGRWYLFYARNFPDTDGGAHPGTALVVDRLAGMTKLAGECKVVLRARHPWTLYEANRRMEVYGRTFDWHTIEGAFVRKHAGRYYCFYSGSNWQTPHYGVDYAVADSVAGPYAGEGAEARVLKGVPGKVRGPGHHSIVKGPDGRTDYFVYHAWDEAMKVRQLCIDRLDWTPQGPRLRGPTYTPQPVPRR